MGIRDRFSHRVLQPGIALASRRLSGRWWVHDSDTSDIELADLPAREGRQTLADGVGPVVQRRYMLEFPAKGRRPEDLIDWFCQAGEAQEPTTYAGFSEPITSEGQTLTVHLAGPWNGPVEVIRRTPTQVSLATRDGHMEAGWITFAAQLHDESLRFTITSVARAGDPAFWLVHMVARIGQWVQADMWSSLLEGAAAAFEDERPARVRIRTTTHDPDAPHQSSAPEEPPVGEQH